MEKTTKNTSLGIALGMCFGVSLGSAFGVVCSIVNRVDTIFKEKHLRTVA